jgi:TM2 domain-containing membrane protein YozV
MPPVKRSISPHRIFRRRQMIEQYFLMKDMSDSQKVLFQNELNAVLKDRTIALLVTLFFGWFGAHHFYLNKTGFGILYLLFFWTLIPAIAAFFELFFIMQRTDQYNREKATEIAAKIKLI